MGRNATYQNASVPRRSKASVRKGGKANRAMVPWRSDVFEAGKRVLFLVLAATCSAISLLNLAPTYGSIPSSLYHSNAVSLIPLVAVSTKFLFTQNVFLAPVRWLPLLAFWIPTVQFMLFKLSSALGPLLGPVLTEVLTLLPLLFLSTAAALGPLKFDSVPSSKAVIGLQGLGCWVIVIGSEKIASSLIPAILRYNHSINRANLQLLVASSYAVLSPSWVMLLAVPALLHSLFLNVHMPFAQTTALLNITVHSQHNYSILSRRESNTGYLSVIEDLNQGFRALRCDHSLLGGEWLQLGNGKDYSPQIGEPIYAIFVMLEAVRLVEIQDSQGSEEQLEDTPSKNALIIGLGVGTSASALILHGVNTTTVEIDPVVYEFAKTYFGLPSNHQSVIEDALVYVEHAAKNQYSYDYIIHDVFTGGAEPAELFTVEFISGLRQLLKPGGVIAINYAGDLVVPSARLVFRTIMSVFPSCRVFREEAPSSKAEGEHDIANVVIFCINSLSPFAFRQPVEADFLGTMIRREFLLPKYEVPLQMFEARQGDGGVLTKATTGRLKEWHKTSAISHWRVMRTVSPAGVWENW